MTPEQQARLIDEMLDTYRYTYGLRNLRCCVPNTPDEDIITFVEEVYHELLDWIER